jgi:antitoxin MazE
MLAGSSGMIYNVYQRRRAAMQIIISKWGNSLGFRIPANVAEAMHLEQGDTVSYELQGEQLVLKKECSTKELFASFYGKPYEALTEQDLNGDGELDWGDDVGGEVLPCVC